MEEITDEDIDEYRLEITVDAKAHIRIEQSERQNKFKVVFKDSCLECGLCTDYCNYGVLSMR